MDRAWFAQADPVIVMSAASAASAAQPTPMVRPS